VEERKNGVKGYRDCTIGVKIFFSFVASYVVGLELRGTEREIGDSALCSQLSNGVLGRRRRWRLVFGGWNLRFPGFLGGHERSSGRWWCVVCCVVRRAIETVSLHLTRIRRSYVSSVRATQAVIASPYTRNRAHWRFGWTDLPCSKHFRVKSRLQLFIWPAQLVSIWRPECYKVQGMSGHDKDDWAPKYCPTFSVPFDISTLS